MSCHGSMRPITTFAVVGTGDLIDHTWPGAKSGSSAFAISELAVSTTTAIANNQNLMDIRKSSPISQFRTSQSSLFLLKNMRLRRAFRACAGEGLCHLVDLSEHSLRKLFCSRNADLIWSFHGVYSSPDHRIDKRVQTAAVPFGRAERSKKGVVQVLPRTPIFRVEFNGSHGTLRRQQDNREEALIVSVCVVHSTSVVFNYEPRLASRRVTAPTAVYRLSASAV